LAALSSLPVWEGGKPELALVFLVVFSKKMATISSRSTNTALISTRVSSGTLPADASAPYSPFSRANSSRREAVLTVGTLYRWAPMA